MRPLFDHHLLHLCFHWVPLIPTPLLLSCQRILSPNSKRAWFRTKLNNPYFPLPKSIPWYPSCLPLLSDNNPKLLQIFYPCHSLYTAVDQSPPLPHPYHIYSLTDSPSPSVNRPLTSITCMSSSFDLRFWLAPQPFTLTPTPPPKFLCVQTYTT